ncbi:iroquois-class homeodomain protein IRX-3 [Protopterus annectens]|uniref:iroquois-class homeodomain protein IRX-3 n=1 Tax=Protopterus annectens TaxID=7888 RepID=UPI001CFBB1D3|nr:iroquois-class homeodomain protein IRX-3 [Protopterus annectens]
MSFPQLGYQYMRPLYPGSERQQGLAAAGGTRTGTELSNMLSSMYSSPYGAAAAAAAAAAAQGYGAFLPYATELPIFPQLGAQYEMKDSPGVQHPAFPHHHPAFYPYGQYQFGDPSRPKNATRESTSTLKAWLNEHRKNPYPTKGEKIMLAIITKMTLTQVSTWFANARRRLKKENKMTWAPRSRTDEEGNSYESDHETEGDKREDEEEIDLENIDTENIESKDDLDDPDPDIHSDSKTDGRSDSEISDGFDDLNGSEDRYLKSVINENRDSNGVKCEFSSQLKPANDQLKLSLPTENVATTQKPKIWSLAETATTPDNPRKSPQISGSAVGPAASNLLTPHRLIPCSVGKFHNWTNRAFSAHQLTLINANRFLNQSTPNTGIAVFSRQGEQTQTTDSSVTDRSNSALDAEKKLLRTAFQPVQRRPQNQLDAAMVLSALSSS